MKFRLLPLIAGFALLLQAQMEMNVSQLAETVRSSVALQHDDRKVAEYLKKVKLTEKLTDKTIEDLMAQGAGPRTVQALKNLRDQSASLKPSAVDPTSSPATAGDETASGPKSSMTIAPKKTATAYPPPDSVKQAQIMEEIKQYASTYTQNLPNFICTQVTRRFIDPSWSPTAGDHFRLLNTIAAKLSYTDGREKYETVLVNNQPIVGNVDQEHFGGGTRSSGEFGSMMREVFDTKTEAQFNWDHWGNLDGKLMAVFNYAIDSAHSQYSIDYNGEQRIVSAYKGLVYADADTGAVYRLTFEAINLPAGFPVRSAIEVLDYRVVDISGSQFICPLRAELFMRDGRSKTRNDIEFRLYKKFDIGSVIKYEVAETPAPLAEEKVNEEPIVAAPGLPASATGIAPPPRPKKQ